MGLIMARTSYLALRFAALSASVLACEHFEDGADLARSSAAESAIIKGERDHAHASVGALIDRDGILCTASLIGPRLILTAAHCLEDEEPKKLRFMLDDRFDHTRFGAGIPIDAFFLHPNYRDLSKTSSELSSEVEENDLAVATLAFEAGVPPMRVAQRPILEQGWTGRDIMFVGFGIHRGGNVEDGRRHAVTLPLEHVYATTFSYGSRIGNLCDDDAGGPAIANTEDGPTIIGVTSWIDEDCEDLGVDTRVDVYASFLGPFLELNSEETATSSEQALQPRGPKIQGTQSPLEVPTRLVDRTNPSSRPALVEVETFILDPHGLQELNPWLSQDELDAALANGAGTIDAPGLGSGLDRAPEPGHFYMLTDRGPNGAREDGITFPLPRFAPTLARVHLDAGAIIVDSVLPIRDATGQPLTGLPNSPRDERPFMNGLALEPLPFDVNGMDPEDVRALPSGDLAISEEYGPSIALVDGQTGRVTVRYVPKGLDLPGRRYPTRAILPRILGQRRKNKGFESLALSNDGHTGFVLTQAPLGEGSRLEGSRLTRIIRIDRFDSPEEARVSGQFAVLHSRASEFPGTRQDKISYSSAAWVSKKRLLLLERGGTRMRLILVDLHGATNLSRRRGAKRLGPEHLEVDGSLEKAGIRPAQTQVVFDSAQSPTLEAVGIEKFEGLAIVDATTVVVSNDNDFGIRDANDTTRVFRLHLDSPLPLEPSR